LQFVFEFELKFKPIPLMILAPTSFTYEFEPDLLKFVSLPW